MALAALAVLALIGFFVFPGHTFLQSDTLIYIPMFDRMMDGSLFEREILTGKQHTTFTAYDELAILLHRVTTLDFEYVLGGIQLLMRFAGLLGIFWIATSLGVTEAGAVLVAALAGLGAFVHGPAVMTIELEPVPRGFSAHLVYLALGLLCHRRFTPASIAVGVALMFHFPAVIPALLVLGAIAVRSRQLKSLGWIAAAAGGIAMLAVLQTGNREYQPVLATVDAQWESLQRFRAPYNWVSAWRSGLITEFFTLAAISAAACARLWRTLREEHRIVFLGLIAIGLLSLGVASITMEQWKWLLMSQVQPARAALFLNVLSVVLPGICAARAMQDRRWLEAVPWSCLTVLMPVHRVITEMPYTQPHLVTVAVLTALVALTAWAGRLNSPFNFAAPLVCAAAAAWMIPTYAKTTTHPPLHHAELDDVARWARANTPKSAMFQFTGFGTRLEPSVFRVRAQRALYWDSKAGGQVNYSRDFSMEWAKRKRDLESGEPDAAGWRTRGVDYLVAEAKKPPAAQAKEIYRNSRYAVFQVGR